MTKFEDHFLENFANSKYIYIYILKCLKISYLKPSQSLNLTYHNKFHIYFYYDLIII